MTFTTDLPKCEWTVLVFDKTKRAKVEDFYKHAGTITPTKFVCSEEKYAGRHSEMTKQLVARIEDIRALCTAHTPVLLVPGDLIGVLEHAMGRTSGAMVGVHVCMGCLERLILASQDYTMALQDLRDVVRVETGRSEPGKRE